MSFVTSNNQKFGAKDSSNRGNQPRAHFIYYPTIERLVRLSRFYYEMWQYIFGEIAKTAREFAEDLRKISRDPFVADVLL